MSRDIIDKFTICWWLYWDSAAFTIRHIVVSSIVDRSAVNKMTRKSMYTVSTYKSYIKYIALCYVLILPKPTRNLIRYLYFIMSILCARTCTIVCIIVESILKLYRHHIICLVQLLLQTIKAERH